MFQTLPTSQALAFIKEKGDQALVMDVRTPEEFEGGHLSMAVNIPVDTIPGKLNSIPTDKTLVIYCEHGSRSKMAANFLAHRGYNSVYHIEGGYSALSEL